MMHFFKVLYRFIIRLVNVCFNVFISKNSSPWEDKVPSVFSVGSPFQLICAYEAIYQFKIDQYRIMLVLEQNDPRNEQTLNLINYFGLKYEVVGDMVSNTTRLHQTLPKLSSYKRGFVGDYRDKSLLAYCIANVSNGSNIVYLDDGGASVNLFMGTGEVSLSDNEKSICSMRNIRLGKSFFSIYDDIKNEQLSICNNKMHFFRESNENKELSEEVLFIGTNILSYLNNYEGYHLPDFVDDLKKCLLYLKDRYSNGKIVYYAHPKDETNYAKSICEELGVEYKISPLTVDLEILLSARQPLCVYGYNSTCLTIIKDFLPKMEVFSFIKKKDMKPHFQRYCEYLNSKGIMMFDVDEQ